MSRWLTNVNALLEKLDDRVETVVEERVYAQDDEGMTAKDAALDDILAKRGLSLAASKDDDDEDDHVQDTNDEESNAAVDLEAGTAPLEMSGIEQEENALPQTNTTDQSRSEIDSINDKTGDTNENVKEVTNECEDESQNATNEYGDPERFVEAAKDKKDAPAEEKKEKEASLMAATSSSEDKTESQTSATKAVDPPVSTPTKKQSTSAAASNPVSRPPPGTPNRSQKEKQLTLDMKEAQKEARTLRRHVVSLNEQLEAAENEIQAQRKELERAAERMEKDRVRTKEEKEASQKRHAQEVALLKAQSEQTLKEQQARFEEQLEGYRKRLAEEENKRKQEGGDWNKEIAQAIDREQEMRNAVSSLEEEKAVLLSQISTLQGQQTALGSRLESLTQAADNAMEREREAEDRLDSLLNQHARQISQRQAREAELERTVQELNAALVASRGHSYLSGVADDANGIVALDSRVKALEMDLETANSHLALERERSETLQMQLRDLSKETTHEATMVHQKQLQADRQIAELQLTISKLENSLREAEKASPQAIPGSEIFQQDEEMAKQIKLLSEEVVRLRDKVANHNSESLAMKHRLKSAVDKANKLEDELANANSSNNRDDVYDSMERAQISRRRRGVPSSSGSIRSAMRLDSSTGDRSEKIGQVVDVVDSFAVSTGTYLRRNPLARAGFIFYLMLIHLWSFVILFFHAHSFDEHGDFGAGVGLPHGPHAMMQQKLVNQVTSINGNAAEAVPTPKMTAAMTADSGANAASQDKNEEKAAEDAKIDADPQLIESNSKKGEEKNSEGDEST